MATYTRKNVYNLGGTWSATILWYARAVQAMQSRKLAEPLSWRFFAAIHGFNEPLWKSVGAFSASDKKPSAALQKRFWKQCQHGSWYFLPWHRGYLMALEATMRDFIVQQKGPKDWALPYWNYFGGGTENKLPPEFASPKWPDGTANNPLYVTRRFGPDNTGKNIYVPLDQVDEDALTKPDFTGVASGGDPGFGGVDTGFEHGGTTHGDLESQPHDMVHYFVGGPSRTNIGLMAYPDTAGLDPIFYLHHSNIDRLWEVWLREPTSLGNPTEKQWLDGPASIGERAFSMPMPPQGKGWDYAPKDVAKLAALDYTYDDLAAPAAAATTAMRLAALGAPAAKRAAKGGAAMPRSRNVELLGASEQPMRIVGKKEVRAAVHLDTAKRKKVVTSLAAVRTGAAAEPDRVFLNLENVRGLNDATAFEVYVKDRRAGSVALFGVSKATNADDEHAGQGLTFVIEITKIVDELHLNNALDVNSLDVRIVPLNEVAEEDKITIGRISIFRQGA